MDSVTAGIMLDAVRLGGVDEMADLYKSLNSKQDDGPTAEARTFFEQHQGKACKIKYTDHEAIIHKLNESKAGFYPGSRYPIYVKITNGDCIDKIFEYDLDQIEII